MKFITIFVLCYVLSILINNFFYWFIYYIINIIENFDKDSNFNFIKIVNGGLKISINFFSNKRIKKHSTNFIISTLLCIAFIIFYSTYTILSIIFGILILIINITVFIREYTNKQKNEY